ncbi:hypothetical protein D3C85_1536090 [compost metagenome]
MLVTFHLRPRCQFTDDERLEDRLSGETAEPAKQGNRRGAIDLGTQVVGVDPRRYRRIRRLDAHLSLALRAQEIAADGQAGLLVDFDLVAVAVHGVKADANLRIRAIQLRAGFDKATRLVGGMGHRSFFAQKVLRHRAQ